MRLFKVLHIIYYACVLHIASFLVGSSTSDLQSPSPSDVLGKADSAFAYFDEDDAYEGDIVDELLIAQSYSGIVFSPEQLLYDDSPICIPSVSQFELTNTLDYSVDIIAVKSYDSQFHPVLFKPQILGPGDSLVVQILFLPHVVELSSTELVIETSEGNLPYKIEGTALPNPYNLQPLLNNKVILGSNHYEIPVSMYNPHPDTLHIMEVFTTEDFITLSSTSPTAKPKMTAPGSNHSVDMVWSITSQTEEHVMTLNIGSVAHPGFHRGFVHIKTDYDKVVIPVEVEFIPGGLRPLIAALDFGIMSGGSSSIDLLIANDGQDNVKITDILIQGNGEGLTAVFAEELMILANRPYTKVATMVYKADKIRAGKHSGKIVMHTNSTLVPGSVLEVPFTVKVLTGGIGFDKDSTAYYYNLPAMQKYIEGYITTHNITDFNAEDESICIAMDKEISFLNYYPHDITVYGIQQLNCQNLVKITSLPPQADIKPFETWSPLTITFCVDKILWKYSANELNTRICWLDITTNVTSHRIPIYIQEGRLEVEYVDAVTRPLAPVNNSVSLPQNITIKKLDYDSYEINMGLISKLHPRDLRIVFSNRDSVSNYVGLQNTTHNACACYETSWPVEYYANDEPGYLRNACTWTSRDYRHALQYDQKRCSCLHVSNRSVSASQLNAKIRPGYSTLVSIVFDNFKGLKPMMTVLNNDTYLAQHMYEMSLTLIAKRQSISIKILFQLTSDKVRTVQDKLDSNGGKFMLGMNSTDVYWSAVATSNETSEILLISQSHLTDTKVTFIQDNTSTLLDNLLHEQKYSNSSKRYWKAEVTLNLLQNKAISKCLQETMKMNPMIEFPSVWALLLGIYCSVKNVAKFTPQWIEAAVKLEGAKYLANDMNVNDLRALTMQMRLQWLYTHRLTTVNMPPTIFVTKSSSLLDMKTINKSTLLVPVVWMPQTYSLQILHSPVGQPVSIYFDLVNPFDLDVKVAFFKLNDPGFVFNYRSKNYCEESAEDNHFIPVQYTFEDYIVKEIVSQSNTSQHPELQCRNNLCSIFSTEYLSLNQSMPVILTSAVRRNWYYNPSTTHPCYTMKQHSVNISMTKRSKQRVGPIVFTPDGTSVKEYKANLIVYNSFTGFEQIEVLVQTYKPAARVQSLQLCNRGDKAISNCVIYSGTTSRPNGARSDASDRSSNKTYVRQEVAVNGMEEKLLIYLFNPGKVISTIGDVEIDGKSCFQDLKRPTSVGKKQTKYNRQSSDPVCKYLPLKLKPSQTLPVEISHLLTCSLDRRSVIINMYDQHSKEVLVSFDLTLQGSKEFVDSCLAISNSSIIATIVAALSTLLLLVVGGLLHMMFSQLISQNSKLTFKYVKTAAVPIANKDLSIHQKFASTIRLLSRMRSASEDGHGKSSLILDLSDVNYSQDIEEKELELTYVTRLQQQRNKIEENLSIVQSPLVYERSVTSPIGSPAVIAGLLPPKSSPPATIKVSSPAFNKIKSPPTSPPIQISPRPLDVQAESNPLDLNSVAHNATTAHLLPSSNPLLSLPISPLPSQTWNQSPMPSPLYNRSPQLWTQTSGSKIGAPPGLEALGPNILTPSSPMASSTDSPLFQYQGQLLEGGSFSPFLVRDSRLQSDLFTTSVRSNTATSENNILHTSSDDIVLSANDRQYLHNLMSTTRAENEGLGRSWESILADLDRLDNTQSSGLGLLDLDGAVLSNISSFNWSQESPWDPFVGQAILANSLQDNAQAMHIDSLVDMIDDDDDDDGDERAIGKGETDTWKNMNEMQTNSRNQWNSATKGTTKDGYAQRAASDMQNPNYQGGSSFFGPGGFFDEDMRGDLLGSLEKEES